MKTIYLDHNIYHYFVRAFPDEDWARCDQAVLETCLKGYPAMRFALSDWSLTEAAQEES